jgi:hypothetical protein
MTLSYSSFVPSTRSPRGLLSCCQRPFGKKTTTLE